MTQSEEIKLRTMEDGSSTSPVLLSPVASDMEDGGWVDSGRQRMLEEPSAWQRRIIVFMGCVSLLCTFIVIAIVVIAVILSKDALPKNPGKKSGDTLHIIPTPMKFLNRSPTIVVHRDYPNIWKSHVAKLSTLLQAYWDRQNYVPSRDSDLAYSPSGGDTYRFPFEMISENCTDRNNFGYDAGSPCVALVFHVQSGFVPKPFNVSNPGEIPELIRAEYDPSLVYLTCLPPQLDLRYTPFHGFSLNSFSDSPANVASTHVPPLVMVQFINPPLKKDIKVTCILWAKNIDHTGKREKFGKVTFNLLII